jgi:hypothetical protein
LSYFAEAKHNVPIGQMGNYHEALMKQEVLRDLNEDDDFRKRPIFGNPYRNDKSPPPIIDEAELKFNKPDPKKRPGSPVNPLISGLFSGLYI